MAAREAAAMPLPNEETTPPVTNTNLVIAEGAERHKREIRIIHHSAAEFTLSRQTQAKKTRITWRRLVAI